MEERLATELNAAETAVLALMVTVHVDVPVHAPDHPENAALAAAVAVRVTAVPAENVA